MDKLRAITCFVRVVEAGSLTAAAQVMGVSLTSVVRSLANLEAELNTRLLTRTTRRIALTDEGRDYFDRCQRILAELEDAEAALQQHQPTGLLRITAPVTFGRLHVAPLVMDFQKSTPTIRTELLLMDRVVNLLEENLDLAVRIGQLEDSSLVATQVGLTKRVVYASPDYLRRHGTPRSPADLADYPCIAFNNLSSDAQWWSFDMNGKIKRLCGPVVFSTNLVDTAIDACINGMGLGMFLDYQTQDAVGRGQLIQVLAEYERPAIPIHILHPGGRLITPRVRSFLSWAGPRLRQRLGNR